MEATQKAMAKPNAVLREEFDDWAVLFDPNTGNTFGLNPVSVYIWKYLDGEHTVNDIAKALRLDCDDVPEDAEEYIGKFIDELVENDMVEIKSAEV